MMKRVCLYVIVTLIIFSQEVKAQSEFNLNSGTPLTFSSFGNGTYNKSVFYHSQSLLLIELAKKSDSNSAIPIDFHINARGGVNQFFTIKGSTGNVGIGTMNPQCKFHIQSGQYAQYTDPYASMIIEEMDARLQIISSDAGSNGSTLSLTNVNSSWTLHQKTSAVNNRFDIGYRLGEGAEDLGAVQDVVMSMLPTGNVGIGTTSPDYKLDVLGTIRAQELKVDMQGADFVFEEDYNLRPLDEVEAFVKANKHLPEIVPAAEMQANGVNQSEMNQKLLQKIEELTLYTIQQQKELRLKNTELELFKRRLLKLESIVSKLK